jgi:hypothetical protein
MLGIEVLLPATAAVIFGSILQASVGYGFALIVVPILLALDPNLVPAPLIIASLALMSWVAFKNRFSLSGHSVWTVLLGLAIGAPIGAILLLNVGASTLAVFVCLLVSIGLLCSILEITVPITKINQFFAGLASNVFGTATGLGGVPLALLYQNESGGRIRAVLSTTFLVGSLMSLVALGSTEQLGETDLYLGLCLVPGVFIGSIAGQKIAPLIDKGYSRVAILILSMCGLIYLLTSL